MGWVVERARQVTRAEWKGEMEGEMEKEKKVTQTREGGHFTQYQTDSLLS